MHQTTRLVNELQQSQNKYNVQNQNQTVRTNYNKTHHHQKCVCAFLLLLIILLSIFGSIKFSNSQVGTGNQLQNNKSIQNKTQSNKVQIALQTVFILQQNIAFMRQWLIYHIQIGVDKFYLYDNGQSTDIQPEQYFLFIDRKKTNKYGFDYKKLMNISIEQVNEEWKSIKEDFKQYLVIIKWEYKDYKKRIIRAQSYSMMDYLFNYGQDSIYTIFLDMDQYLFSSKKYNLKQILKQYQNFNFSQIIIKQKKFRDRFCAEGKKVTEIFDCIQLQHFIAQKKIIRNSHIKLDYDRTKIYDTQYHGKEQGIIKIGIDKLRVNQYNLNTNSMKQIKTIYKQVNAFQVCHDQSMKIFQEKIEQKCHNKCSNKKFAVNFDDKEQHQRLCFNKEYKFLNQQEYLKQYQIFKQNLKKQNQLKKRQSMQQKQNFFQQRNNVKQIPTEAKQKLQESMQNFAIEDSYIAVHTVFILYQNIPYIRQWLIYHIALGVDKFYMYDNSNSRDTKRNPFLNIQANINKYGIPYQRLIGKTTSQINNEWESIKKDFQKYIVHIIWEPKDENGVIQYQWSKSYVDYLNNYGNQHIYTAFIDIDQFIFSKSNLSLKKTLKDLQSTQFTRLRIIQKRFTDRFCSEGKTISEIIDCINIDTTNFSPKTIVRNQYASKQPPKSMHQIKTFKGQLKIADINEWRFNHYNINGRALNWMSEKKFHTKVYSQCQDSSMTRYSSLIKKQCKGKCSDQLFSIKWEDKDKKQNICSSKEVQLLNQKDYEEKIKVESHIQSQ